MKHITLLRESLIVALSTISIQTMSQTIPPIGTIPAGDSIIIVYDVTINSGATSISNQGSISGSNFTAFVTNDPKTATANDATVTAVSSTAYYPLTTATDLSSPLQWTANVTGATGTAPSNFTSPDQLFNISNTVTSPQVNGAWTISGGSNAIINNTNGLTFNPEASLTIGTGSTFDFKGKAVTLKSDASGTAFIGTIAGVLLNADNVTVERFITSNSNRAYRLLAPSVNTTTTIRANWQENGVNSSGKGTHITGSTTGANGFDATITGQPSMYTYDAATLGWTAIGNTNVNTLNAKTGYLLFVRGDRTIDLSSTQSPLPSNNTTVKATGTLLTGLQSFSGLTGNSGFSLITNPYAAPINWANVQAASTGVTQFYTLWDPNIGSRGAYVTVSTAGVSSNAAGSNATVDIQSGQAFFVQAAGATSPVVNIAETHKSTGNHVDVFRVGNQTEKFSASLFFTDEYKNRKNADGVLSLYNNDYSKNVDKDDATQIPNWDEDIAINRNGKQLSIESRPLIDAADTINLSIERLKLKNYEWQFDVSDFNYPNLQASLIDKYLDNRTPISLTSKTVIPFNVTADAASSALDRFMVVFVTGSTLPVHLTTAKAYQKNAGIQVEWVSQNETNIDRYEVEKSADARQFNKAFTVGAKGSNGILNYDWLDVNASNGNNYYRIKAIGKTGEVVYSSIMKVTIGKVGSFVTVYPNPISDNKFVLSLNLVKGRYSVMLTDEKGQQVYLKQIDHPGGFATQTIQLGKQLSSGVYQLKVTGIESHFVQQVIKN